MGTNDIIKETRGLPRKINQNGHDGSMGLARLAQMLPTPTATDWKGSGSNDTERGRLDYWAEKPDGKRLPGQLNPRFVEQMMGYPVGWTDLEVSVTL